MYEYKAEAIRVIDGDTVKMRIDCGFSMYRDMTVRLYGINTPELGTAAGSAAKNALSSMLGKPLTIKTHKDKQDKYGRYLAEICTDSGLNVNAEMVRMGHAVEYFP